MTTFNIYKSLRERGLLPEHFLAGESSKTLFQIMRVCVNDEDYETAAILRDVISRRGDAEFDIEQTEFEFASPPKPE